MSYDGSVLALLQEWKCVIVIGIILSMHKPKLIDGYIGFVPPQYTKRPGRTYLKLTHIFGLLSDLRPIFCHP